MSAAFIKGVDAHLPDARVTFDKLHAVAHASKALDGVRRAQRKIDPSLKVCGWSLLKDAEKLNLAQLTESNEARAAARFDNPEIRRCDFYRINHAGSRGEAFSFCP
ncbi:protein of unknown function (plasmid) [Caballeronia sp. S22]